MNLKKNVSIPIFVISESLLSLIGATSPAHAEISWLSRANCTSSNFNESVTWDWPWKEHRWLWTQSNHINQNMFHKLDTGWQYTWHSYAGHWGEGVDWAVFGYHYIKMRDTDHVQNEYTKATGCNSGDWLSSKIEEQAHKMYRSDTSRPPLFKGLRIVPLDQQPLPDELKKSARKRIASLRMQDVLVVDEKDISDFDKMLSNAMPLLRPLKELQAEHLLYIKPANFQNTKLRDAIFVGARPQGGRLAKGWTGLFRLFDASKLGLGWIALEELDYIISGSGISVTQEEINADINGHPATLISKKTPGGKTMTSLTWFTDKKSYVLSSKQVDVNSRAMLLDIARNIKD